MLTEAEMEKLFCLLMTVEDFRKGELARTEDYRALEEEYTRLSLRLCDQLDDRRAELFSRLVKARDGMEKYRCLHYLRQGLLRGKENRREM